jgi:uncharacterized protein (DUF2147 family)
MMAVVRRLPVLCIAVVLSLSVSTGSAWAAGPVGLWLTEGGKSRVEITQCGEMLCGTIVWLKEPLDENSKEKVDKNNPDDALKSRRLVGLKLLNGFVPGNEDGVWVKGTIYNPEDGDTYKCTMRLNEEGNLKVRGYVGIPLFGKTQIWTRVSQ